MFDDLEMKKMFNSVDGDTLLDMDLPATKFVIKDLLPQGLAIIGGSPKVGKSWLMLDWCVRIAKGEKIWNFPTTQGTTLYVSLEDTASRLQERLLSVTDEAPNVFFTTFSFKIGEGLEEQVKNFIAEHPDTVLIVIDTFQMIRNTGSEISYASDYNEVEVIICVSRATATRSICCQAPTDLPEAWIQCLFLTRASGVRPTPRSTAQGVTLRTERLK